MVRFVASAIRQAGSTPEELRNEADFSRGVICSRMT